MLPIASPDLKTFFQFGKQSMTLFRTTVCIP